jgi:6-phosphogluconolactonase
MRTLDPSTFAATVATIVVASLATACGDDLQPPSPPLTLTLQREPAGAFNVFPSDAVTFKVQLQDPSSMNETDLPVPQGSGTASLTVSLTDQTDVTITTVDGTGRTIGVTKTTLVPGPTEATVPVTFDLPRIAYADSFGDTRLFQYAIDPMTGALTQTAIVNVGNGPQNPILNQRSSLLYVANGRDNTVATLRIAADGSLTEVLPRVATGGNPVVGTMSPDGLAVYFPEYIDNDIISFRIDPSTGLLSELTPRLPAAGVPRDIIIDATGAHAYLALQGATELRTYSIDASTHALSAIASATQPSGAGSREGALHPNGKFLYLTSAQDNTIWVYQLNGTTGAPTAQTPPVSTGMFPLSVTIHPNGLALYVCNYMANTVSQFAIDPATGALTPGGPDITVPSPRAVLFDPSNSFVYITSFGTSGAISQFTVNPTTGALLATGSPAPAGVNTSFVTFLR